MIDPFNITIYHRTDSELQEFALFCACVAGKNSVFVSKYVNAMSDELGDNIIDALAQMSDHSLLAFLQNHRTGQYSRLVSAVRGLSRLNLRVCSLDDLLSIKGVGQKTARFFLLHSRKDVNVAVLDTHILRWMRHQGVSTPSATPTSVVLYKKLEAEYHHLRSAFFPNLTPAQADLEIWTNMRALNKGIELCA